MDTDFEEISKKEIIEIIIWSLPNFLADIRLDEIDDPLYSDQWHLNNTGQGGGTYDVDIDAPLAWSITTGSSDITVAIIDGGVASGSQTLVWEPNWDKNSVLKK